MTSAPTIAAGAAGEYPIARSPRLALILILGHCGVAALVLVLELASPWKIAAIALVAASLVYELWMRVLQHGPNAVVALRIAVDNVLSLRTRRGECLDCEVLGSTYVTSFLTVLILRPAGWRRVCSVVILPDAMAADDYRRLRVWLRWRPQAEGN